MIKILNLDKLATAQNGRELVMGGVTYPVNPMSVANFIETTHAIERLSQGTVSAADQIIAMVDMICRCVPTLPRTTLETYPLDTLSEMAAFVRGEDVPDQEMAQTSAQTPAQDPVSAVPVMANEPVLIDPAAAPGAFEAGK